MFQALLILLAAATPGSGERRTSSNRPDGGKESLRQRQANLRGAAGAPDHTLNDVALQVATEDANKWLQKNAVGATVQVAGKVSYLSRRQAAAAVYNPENTRQPSANLVLHLGLQPHAARWGGFTLHMSYDAVFTVGFAEELEPRRKGDRAAVKGIIVAMTSLGERMRRPISDVTLRDCTLVKTEKPPP